MPVTRVQRNKRKLVQGLQQQQPPSNRVLSGLDPSLLLYTLDFCDNRTRKQFERTSKSAFHLPCRGSADEPIRLSSTSSHSLRTSVNLTESTAAAMPGKRQRNDVTSGQTVKKSKANDKEEEDPPKEESCACVHPCIPSTCLCRPCSLTCGCACYQSRNSLSHMSLH
jgi:hypothetical protein